jgi:6,7-dimethyl-8-ribityllumazine synthase
MPEQAPRGRGLRVALVVSRYNDFVTDRLRDAAIDTLVEAGVAREAITLHAVPGAYEIPQGAAAVAAALAPDAIVCLGCVIRGATPHFDYICAAVAHGVTQAALASRVPMAFGVLTTNSVEEALERAASGPANKGREAALAALDLAALFGELR